MLIVGFPGQDGRLLSELLAARAHGWVGVGRAGVESNLPGETFGPISLTNPDEVVALVAKVRPAMVFYLAAHHGSAENPRALSVANSLAARGESLS